MKSVWITDLRTREMQNAHDYLSAQGWQVLTSPEGLCLWDEAAVHAFVASCGEMLSGVIHPAPPPFQCPLEKADEARAAQARDEGALAAWCVAKAAGSLFRKKGAGTMIWFSSVHAEKPMGYGTLFSAGCGAVQMLSREISQDYGPDGVLSFFVQRGPSADDPDLTSDLTDFYCGTELRYPTRRLPEEGSLNPLLAFLLTPAAVPLNGSDLRADGGMTMYYGQRINEPVKPMTFAPSPVFTVSNPTEIRKDDRVAIVTGSGKGVGAGIARVLCVAGIRCVINCNSNRTMAEKTLAEIREAGGEAFIFQADVSDPEQVRAMIAAAAERYGRLDILVNNAAMQFNRFVDQYDSELIRRLWDINFGGYLRTIREALPYLRKSPLPRIVNIGSVHGKRPTCFDAGYAMTKGAVKMLTREAAIELLPDKIPVTCISLGGARIEFKTGEPPFCNTRPKEVNNPNLRVRNRLVLPEEVGEAVRYLCSEAGEALTGSCIRIDCGQMLR